MLLGILYSFGDLPPDLSKFDYLLKDDIKLLVNLLVNKPDAFKQKVELTHRDFISAEISEALRSKYSCAILHALLRSVLSLGLEIDLLEKLAVSLVSGIGGVPLNISTVFEFFYFSYNHVGSYSFSFFSRPTRKIVVACLGAAKVFIFIETFY